MTLSFFAPTAAHNACAGRCAVTDRAGATPTDHYAPTGRPQSVVACTRCGSLCQFTGDRNPDARVMRRSAVPKGLCANCAATLFLKNTEPLPTVIERQGVECLLRDDFQAQFAKVLEVGVADAAPSEIDWRAVVAAWELPFPKAHKKAVQP